jgi:hypothetical protein
VTPRPPVPCLLAVCAALVLAACGGSAPEVDPVVPDGDGASPPQGEVTALAEACDELEARPLDPPAEEQPPPDGALTDQEPGSGDDGGAMEQLREWADQEAGEHYGGLWIDPDAGATVVAFTEDVEGYAEVVRERFGDGWWVVEVEHSERQLREVQDEIGQRELRGVHPVEGDGSGWDDDGPLPGTVHATGLRSPINRVTVSVVEPDDERVAELSERYGAVRICLEVTRLPGDEDAEPAPWEPAPGTELSPDVTTIDVLVNEVGCAGGEPADDRIPAPDITYDDDAVVVTIGVVPRPGDQTCPGNPDTAYQLELDEPLGERELLDGSHDPPLPPDLDRRPGDR